MMPTFIFMALANQFSFEPLRELYPFAIAFVFEALPLKNLPILDAVKLFTMLSILKIEIINILKIYYSTFHFITLLMKRGILTKIDL